MIECMYYHIFLFNSKFSIDHLSYFTVAVFLLAFGLSTWYYRRTLAVESGKTSALEMAKFKEEQGSLLYFIKHYLIKPWVPGH